MQLTELKFEQLLNQGSNLKLNPIYFLHGDEKFLICGNSAKVRPKFHQTPNVILLRSAPVNSGIANFKFLSTLPTKNGARPTTEAIKPPRDDATEIGRNENNVQKILARTYSRE